MRGGRWLDLSAWEMRQFCSQDFLNSPGDSMDLNSIVIVTDEESATKILEPLLIVSLEHVVRPVAGNGQHLSELIADRRLFPFTLSQFAVHPFHPLHPF